MVWKTATELAAKLLAQHALRPSPGHMLSNRVLPDEHFEFRVEILEAPLDQASVLV